jgi:predicted translin family RNA/ssDNA-binding protein
MHVTPTKTSYALLRELQELTGKAPATITRELLDEAVPALEGAIEAMRMLKERPNHAMQAVGRMIDTAMHEVTQARLDLDSAMDKKAGRKPGKKQGQGAANTG